MKLVRVLAWPPVPVFINNQKKLEFRFLELDTDKPRTYGLVSDEAWRKKEVVGVPLLLGCHHAGDPILADEHIEDIVKFDSNRTSRDQGRCLHDGRRRR